jgi:Ca2+-binding EF-hand superfamily protein
LAGVEKLITSRKTWIATGIVATAVGLTALVAHAERGGRDGYGHGGPRGGWQSDDGERGSWRRSRGGKMTREEYDNETRAMFAAWDANVDGIVDSAEAQAAISNRRDARHGGRGGHRMQRIARGYDADNDGKVTLEEVQAKVTKRFARMDLDGDGKITDADLPPIMRGQKVLSGGDEGMGRHGWGHGHHHGHKGRWMIRYLRGADADKDDAVTLQELQDRAAMRFARLDHNKDGVIDQADRDTMRKAMMEYGAKRFMHRYGAVDGKLTLEQFSAYRAARFTERDADGDSAVERDDRNDRGGSGRNRRWNDRDGDGERGSGPEPDENRDGEPAPERPDNR